MSRVEAGHSPLDTSATPVGEAGGLSSRGLIIEMRATDGGPVADVWPARPSPLSPYLRSGDGVLDLGANVGEFTRDFAKRVGPTGAVLAVEAHPQTAMVCRMLAQPYPWVQVMAAAVSDRAGVAMLHLDAKNGRRNSLYRENLTHDSPQTYPVPTVTLDDLAEMVPNLKAIKVDIQGAEGAMLRGGRRTIKRKTLTWCVELWALGLAMAGGSIDATVGTFQAYDWYPVGTTWDAVLERAAAKPHGVENVVLQHG